MKFRDSKTGDTLSVRSFALRDNEQGNLEPLEKEDFITMARLFRTALTLTKGEEICAQGGNSLLIILKKNGEYAWQLTVKAVLWPNKLGKLRYTATDAHVTESQLNDYAEEFDDMAFDWNENVVEAEWISANR